MSTRYRLVLGAVWVTMLALAGVCLWLEIAVVHEPLYKAFSAFSALIVIMVGSYVIDRLEERISRQLQVAYATHRMDAYRSQLRQHDV